MRDLEDLLLQLFIENYLNAMKIPANIREDIEQAYLMSDRYAGNHDTIETLYFESNGYTFYGKKLLAERFQCKVNDIKQTVYEMQMAGLIIIKKGDNYTAILPAECTIPKGGT